MESISADTTANQASTQVKYDQILSRNTSAVYPVIIRQTTRNDSLYSAPALTAAAFMQPVGSAKTLNGQIALVTEIDSTQRAANGQTYQYAKIIVGGTNHIYWLDLRALETTTYASVKKTGMNDEGYINENGRHDGAFLYGPALTSAETFQPAFDGATVNSQQVRILEMDKTDRGNDQYYSYYQVQDQSGKTYWIDTRAVTIYHFAQIDKRSPENFQAIVDQSSRHDYLYSNPALTSLDTMKYVGDAQALNQKLVTVTELVDTKRPGNSQTYTYAHIQNGSADYWIDYRAIKRIDFDQITDRMPVDFTAAINGSSRNDGLYSAPAQTDPNSWDAIAQASWSGFNHRSVQVSEIDTTKRASNGRTYQYARITLDGKTYFWIDLRGLFSPILSRDNVDYSAWITPQTGQDQGLYTGLPKNSPDAFSSSQTVDSLIGRSIQVTEIDRLSDNATQAVEQFAKILVDGKTYWLRLENLQFARIVSQKNFSGQSLIVQKKTHRNDGIFVNGPGLTAMNTLLPDRQGLPYNAHQVTLLKEVVTVRPNGGQYTYVYVQDGNQHYWIDAHALASGFQYVNGVKYYDPNSHVLKTNATVWDRGHSYHTDQYGNLTSGNSQIERAISAGLSIVGKSPYLWGGGRNDWSVAERRFDCSSFVYWCYQQAGIVLGKRSIVVTWSLAEEGRPVSWDSMKRGDIFLMDEYNHIGIYLGGGYFLHDSPNSPTGGVGISNLSDIVNPDNFPYTWEGIRDNCIRRIVG
ncbi:GW dipeptide domain-containing protein [Oenococcus kitaharae]|nr:GW dipeptide domain-containing protein [Oenococcus kitaharae]